MNDNETFKKNLGSVISIRGSVVDVRFDKKLPPIYSLLKAKEGKISIEVLSQLDSHSVRGIALTPTQGLARENTVEDTGGPLKAPVGKEILSRIFNEDEMLKELKDIAASKGIPYQVLMRLLITDGLKKLKAA